MSTCIWQQGFKYCRLHTDAYVCSLRFLKPIWTLLHVQLCAELDLRIFNPRQQFAEQVKTETDGSRCCVQALAIARQQTAAASKTPLHPADASKGKNSRGFAHSVIVAGPDKSNIEVGC